MCDEVDKSIRELTVGKLIDIAYNISDIKYRYHDIIYDVLTDEFPMKDNDNESYSKYFNELANKISDRIVEYLKRRNNGQKTSFCL